METLYERCAGLDVSQGYGRGVRADRDGTLVRGDRCPECVGDDTAEATALELAGYADQCGGLDNVASVLAELVESLDAEKPPRGSAALSDLLGAAPRLPARFSGASKPRGVSRPLRE
jgi:AbiEi antitoxin C-terminal domain